MRTRELPLKIAQDWFGVRSLPINYTLGLTYRCNSRCLTCHVYERQADELSLKEWEKIFKSLGTSPYWVTLTGGEPFIRQDIVELYYLLCDICQPAMVNIPTNGILTEKIFANVWEMTKVNPRVKLTINVSIDHSTPSENDMIRGVPGHYHKAFKTVQELSKIDSDNLSVGIHSVISKWNVKEMPMISEVLKSHLKNQNLYITEIAENREELGTWGKAIGPQPTEYQEAIESVCGGKGLKQKLRQEYYGRVVRYLMGQDTGLKCYAGWSSVQITPDGDVWPCCIKAQKIGNVRQERYNFNNVWFGLIAEEMRYRNRDCQCPLANVAYTNMLHSPRALASIAMRR